MSDAIEGEIVNQPPLSKLTKHDENIVQVLETAFHNGYNITEACQQADISREIYYRWLRDDDIFSYRMSVAQSALNRKAKTNVFDAINNGDPNISLRYLTLRDPDFKPKAEVTTIPDVIEARNNLKGVIDEISKHDPSVEPIATAVANDSSVVEDDPTDIS